MQNFPHVPEVLLRALVERFPDALPEAVPDAPEMGRLVGQQQVIRFLNHQHTLQLETQLEGSQL